MNIDPIKRIGVVGAGQMGRGIAQVAAQAGYRVVIVDVSVDRAKAALAKIAASLARRVDKAQLTAEESSRALARLSPAGELASLADSQVIIEATPENESLKKDLLAKLDALTPRDTIFASNTSSIAITTLAASTQRPEKVIGMHFMNPVPAMKLVEIVRALTSSDETCELVKQLAQRFGKTTIVSRDIPGFIVNRILTPLLNEACFALYEGLGSAEDIDTGIQLGLNHPMGPLALADLIGLDTCLAITEVLHSQLGDDKYRACPLLRQYVAAGWLGRKTGRGFYSYQS